MVRGERCRSLREVRNGYRWEVNRDESGEQCRNPGQTVRA